MLSRLQEIVSYSGLSVRAFASSCGVSQATFDKQLRGRSQVSVETLQAVLASYPEISTEWLMRGSGNMLLDQTNADKDSSELINRLVDAIATLQATINNRNSQIAELNCIIANYKNQKKP